MKPIVAALIATTVLGGPVFTQDAPEVARAPQAAQERTAQAPQPERPPADERERTAPPPPAAPPPPSERRAIPTRNVKVDVTITEQTGSSAPIKKTVTLLVAEGRSSGVRSLANIPLATGSHRELPLNVDASVNITPEQKVLLELRFQYTSVSVMTPVAGEGRPAPTNAAERDAALPKPGFSTINDSLTLLLTPGMPVVAARSADAVSDRTVTVEVKAEIQK